MLKQAYYRNKEYLNEKENEKELSQEDCFNIAKSYLNEYIDLDNFELTYSGEYKTSYSKMNYYFDFMRIVNGFLKISNSRSRITTNAKPGLNFASYKGGTCLNHKIPGSSRIRANHESLPRYKK